MFWDSIVYLYFNTPHHQCTSSFKDTNPQLLQSTFTIKLYRLFLHLCWLCPFITSLICVSLNSKYKIPNYAFITFLLIYFAQYDSLWLHLCCCKSTMLCLVYSIIFIYYAYYNFLIYTCIVEHYHHNYENDTKPKTGSVIGFVMKKEHSNIVGVNVIWFILYGNQ